MLTGEELQLRREVIAESPDLAALQERLRVRARGIIERNPGIPALKGMLTADGGVCPDDRTALLFDPWSPGLHRCGRCGKTFKGDHHDRRWAWLGHLWLAERIAELAAVGTLDEDERLTTWAGRTIAEYGKRYLSFPNADNVLGPARLFFSTYLESVWLTSYLAGAFLLREAGALDAETVRAVDGVAEEAANLIGEFDEGLSNRQTWHNAALAATAVWFEDADLAQRAMEGPRGLVGHLVDGFGADGMWYEGENYHLFALRGMLTGLAWARLAGVEFFEEEASQQRIAAALRAPILSALPDGTFPARKDARFGVSLAQPMYLELWENGLASLLANGHSEAAADVGDWLRHLYALPAPVAEIFDSYLHESGEEPRTIRGRSDLSWWMLATMSLELPGQVASWKPASVLLPEQGLAILRHDDRYVSLECGEYAGGHGHPDRLHLTLHAGGRHWLADPGTGSYVAPDLFWYRGTLAHNAPRIDGTSQVLADARAEMFEVRGRWGWVRGRFDRLTRTVVVGPAHLVDVVEFADEEEHLVELPWHLDGDTEILSPGRWEPAELVDGFAHDAERFVPVGAGPIAWRTRVNRDGPVLEGIFDGGGELLRARAPARPGAGGEREFLVRRQRGRYVRFASVLAFDAPALAAASFTPGEIVVQTASGTAIHRQTSEGWDVEADGARVALRGLRREGLAKLEMPVVGLFKYKPPEGTAFHASSPPALDGSLDGFVIEEPLTLDHEDQYRRTEEPYPGPEMFAAQAWLAWDETALYVAVAVTKDDLSFRPALAPPLRLDNESDLIHSDGLQLYLQVDGERSLGWLVVPDPAGTALQVHPIVGTGATGREVRGSWRKIEEGYLVTLALSSPGWPPGPNVVPPKFDLIVNEMRTGRTRRLGQLVWTGGGGWSYVRGDRQDLGRAGQLLLA